MNKVHLSKSRYCRGVQCEKILWLEKYRSESSKESNGAVLEKGLEVGELAKGLFGDYEDVPFDADLSVSIDKTRELLKNRPNVITEASFAFENNFCNVDILKNDEVVLKFMRLKAPQKSMMSTLTMPHTSTLCCQILDWTLKRYLLFISTMNTLEIMI